jgi:hypothetical protein
MALQDIFNFSKKNPDGKEIKNSLKKNIYLCTFFEYIN